MVSAKSKRATNALTLKRQTFTTSRELEYTSEAELVRQTGHPVDQWPLVVAKELGDNALDACEEHQVVAPDISFTVSTARGHGAITVIDNGPGIPAKTIAELIDFSVRVSSREAYVSPTRGAQGNALKTILAMPFVLGGDNAGPVIFEAHGIRHSITVSADVVRQKPVAVRKQEPSKRKKGTAITVPWPNVSLLKLREQKLRFLQIVRGFALLNPHATIRADWDGERVTYKAIDPDFNKWLSRYQTPPCWYDEARLERLLAAYAHEDIDRQRLARTVREFVSEFRGLTGSAKTAEVLETTGLARVNVGDLFKDGKPTKHIKRLLATMQGMTMAVKPVDLGVIGADNFRHRFASLGADLESFQYKRMLGTDDEELPYVIEAAFAYVPEEDHNRLLMTGVNFSPAIMNPFRQLGSGGEGLERVLAGQMIESKDPVVVALHLTAPVITYLDRGKSSLALRGGETLKETEDEQENNEHWLNEVDEPLDGSVAGDVIAAVKAVTKAWYKQRRAELRDANARSRRHDALSRRRQKSQRSIAFEVMDDAYRAASGGERELFTNARQIMYAARPQIQSQSGKQLSDSYFTQTLLPDYVAEFDPDWKDKVAFDERGHFVEPHTGKLIGLGTVAVREYLDEMAEPTLVEVFEAKVETHGPSGRFGGVFFCEKEGFDALWEQVQIAERYDLAFMSCKGISVTAARELADKMCAEHDIPLYLLTDFDKSGFTGSATFEQDNRRYTYENDIKVYRLGLRLNDVRAIAELRGIGIEDLWEEVFDKGSEDARRANLRRNGATEEEADFLLRHRVELNALTSDELVDFVERKLQDLGVKKIVPNKQDLVAAYRLFKRGVSIREMVAEAIANAEPVPVPKDLERQVRAYLEEHPEAAWDTAVAKLTGWTRDDS